MEWVFILLVVAFLVGITIVIIGLSLVFNRKSVNAFSLRRLLKDNKKDK